MTDESLEWPDDDQLAELVPRQHIRVMAARSWTMTATHTTRKAGRRRGVTYPRIFDDPRVHLRAAVGKAFERSLGGCPESRGTSVAAR
jgi:hypothetical protein